MGKVTLSGKDALDIRRMYLDRSLMETYRTLAHLFNVSEGTIANVVDRKGRYRQEEIDFPYSGSSK